jgi:hypothetical protein
MNKGDNMKTVYSLGLRKTVLAHGAAGIQLPVTFSTKKAAQATCAMLGDGWKVIKGTQFYFIQKI